MELEPGLEPQLGSRWIAHLDRPGHYVIVGVLSKSTEAYDRSAKCAGYRTLRSLESTRSSLRSDGRTGLGWAKAKE